MREQIIAASIDSLRQEGLRFSVDTLAERLRISKKTIYKYFPDKEALARALYQTYYDEAVRRLNALLGAHAAPDALLHLYFDSKMMIRDDIFNKYKLNDAIHAYAAGRHDALWAQLYAALPGASAADGDALRIIIDGSFEKLCRVKAAPDAVIERLVTLL